MQAGVPNWRDAILVVECKGPAHGTSRPVPQVGGSLWIGREADCALRFLPEVDYQMVSRRHARIETNPNGVFVIANRSSSGNKTLFDNQEMVPDQPYQLVRAEHRLILGPPLGPAVVIRASSMVAYPPPPPPIKQSTQILAPQQDELQRLREQVLSLTQSNAELQALLARASAQAKAAAPPPPPPPSPSRQAPSPSPISAAALAEVRQQLDLFAPLLEAISAAHDNQDLASIDRCLMQAMSSLGNLRSAVESLAEEKPS